MPNGSNNILLAKVNL